MSDVERVPPGAGAGKPTPAGMYDCWLGGTASTPTDRAAAERVRKVVPEIRQVAWANRGFLSRAASWLAEHGIRQFIDIGAGLPTQRCTHEIVQGIAPGCRVLYTDNDPVVIARGEEILAGVPGTAVIEADVRHPEELFGHPAAQWLIDFTEPVGLLMVAVTQFIPDADDPWNLVRRHVVALAAGSYLALSAPTADHKLESRVRRTLEVYASSTVPVTTPRTKADVGRFFTGLEIVPPYDGAGPEVTHVGLWNCEDPEAADDDASRWFYAAVARKP